MRRSIVRSVTVANLFALALFSSAYGADPGRAVGTLTIDAAVTPLEFAVATRKDDLFDETRKDTVIVLTDKRLGNTRPDDEIDLSVRARRGDLVALALRIDG